jgi:hypothetical protein
VATISTPSGVDSTNVYYVNVILPNKVRVERVRAIEGIPSNCDALIGMDIIGLGDFAVTNHNGKTVFSFRMPSLQTFDFSEYTYDIENKISVPKRNDLCPCGSGKKYKNCHGKNT